MKRTIVGMVSAIFALLLAAVSLNAGATVVYGWYPVNEDVSYPVPSYGRFKVTDAAYRAGSMDYSFGRFDGYETDPSSPLMGVEFGGSLLQPRVADGTNYWSVQTYVQFGEYLTGLLIINELDNTYWMGTGGDPLWSISFISDNLDTGCHEMFCSGATGYWKLEQGPSAVPEPDMFVAFGFLALAMLGAETARRRHLGRHRQSVIRI